MVAWAEVAREAARAEVARVEAKDEVAREVAVKAAETEAEGWAATSIRLVRSLQRSGCVRSPRGCSGLMAQRWARNQNRRQTEIGTLSIAQPVA